MSLDGHVAGPRLSVTHPLGERGDELHKWEGGTTGPDYDVAAESLQNIGATSTPVPCNSSISASENAST
jgi:hypothetical protein